MRLRRIAVSQVRQFRTPFELADLQPGLNLFTGPNEAGKSTLVRAIRAAVFERHRSTSVEDLRPFGDADASPTVMLEFDFAGEPHRLTKSFLKTRRCELLVGHQRLEGPQAEDALAERLGFEFAARGGSRPECWGIPGLLWIEQGTGHAVHEAAAHASSHLLKALESTVSEVASSGGDEVVAEVQRRRDEWLTVAGAPRGDYKAALERARELSVQAGSLAEAVESYRQQVDRLRSLRAEHRAAAAEAAWAGLREQEAARRADLAAAEGLGSELGRLLVEQQHADAAVQALTRQIADGTRQTQELRDRADRLIRSQAALEADLAQQAACERQAEQASRALQRADAALAQARQESDRAAFSAQREAARQRRAELQMRIEQVAERLAAAQSARASALRDRLPAADLQALRQRGVDLREIEIRQSAMATRLGFAWHSAVQARLDGEALPSAGERLLVRTARLSIEGVGELVIEPGSDDLASLANDQRRLQDEQSAHLRRLGVAHLEEALARAQAAERAEAEARAAEASAALLAPTGLPALQGEHAEAVAREAEALDALSRWPAAPGGAVLPLPQAQAEQAAARAAADAALAQVSRAREGTASSRSQHEAGRREHDELARRLQDGAWAAGFEKTRHSLDEATRQLQAVQARIAGVQAQLLAAQPERLRQDVRRLAGSAEALEAQHRQRAETLIHLEAELAAQGMKGLEEDFAQVQAEQAMAERRVAEIAREARALDFLLQRLLARRQALTLRLQAPLQARIAHYLPLLFPGGSLALTETLQPQSLRRDAPPESPRSAAQPATELAPYETLSLGAREQMGLVCRLAYADLLAAAGRPTLIILDDALVHSDEGRLDRMKRVLFDAAQRHQVLLFTCHPARWRDLGVAVRPLRP